MSVNAEATAGVPASAIAALMLAVFTVSVGFGVVLPNPSCSPPLAAESLT